MPGVTKRAYEAAVELLSRRLLSEGDLTAKLYAKQAWTSAEIHAAVAELKRIGAVNDGRLAESMIRLYRDRGYGPAKIRLEMRKHHFPDEAVNYAMAGGDEAEYLPEQDEADNAAEALRRKESQLKRESDPMKRKAKAVRFLMGRGFSCGDAVKAYGKWLQGQEISEDEGGDEYE